MTEDKTDEFTPDESLWIDLDGSCGEKRHYLAGNAHTHPGRMRAWCPAKRKFVTISKSEIVACSRESRYWISGFLHGNAPTFPMSPEGNYLPDDAPEIVRWWRAIDEFQETGYWCSYDRTCEACGAPLLPTSLTERCAKCAESAG